MREKGLRTIKNTKGDRSESRERERERGREGEKREARFGERGWRERFGRERLGERERERESYRFLFLGPEDCLLIHC